jgi:hypothetical protein
VVVATPLIVVVRVAPDIERAFDVIREVVAVRPLIVVERMFPAVPCVKELMSVATDEEIPLTMVWKKLADDEAVLEVMIVDVPTEPPRLLVRVLPEDERELEVERLVTVAEVTVRLEDVRPPDTVRFVAEAFASVV